MLSSFRSFKDKVAPRIVQLKEITYNIDQEARFTTELLHSNLEEARYQEIIRLLSSNISQSLGNNMLFGKLPFQNLPERQNLSFFGRERELGLLEDALHPNSLPTKLASCCLHGLAGAGKTQIALQFAYQHSDTYQAVLWAAAETPNKLAESFNAIAHGIGLADESVQHPDQLKEVVKRWLFNTSRRGM